MKNWISFTFALIFPLLFTQAQTEEAIDKKALKKYKPFLDSEAKLLAVSYYQTVEKAKGDGNYIQKTYNPDKVILTQKVTYYDKGLTLKHGPSIDWFDNGEKWQEGDYKENERHGPWKFYNSRSGKLDRQGNYVSNEKQGAWSILDSLGNRIGERSYDKGELHGIWYDWGKDGELIYQAEYKDGELQREEIIDDEQYESRRELTDEEWPYFGIECGKPEVANRKQCSQAQWQAYIYQRLRYPQKARRQNIEGIAIVSFVIDPEGQLEQVEVLRGVCDSLEDECMRVLKDRPNWVPASKGGKKLPVSHILPIRFRLE